MWISRTNFVCLLCFLGFIASASTSYAASYIYLHAHGAISGNSPPYGLDCSGVNARFKQKYSSSKVATESPCVLSYFYGTSWRSTRASDIRYKTCTGDLVPRFNNSAGVVCGEPSDSQCDCATETECEQYGKQIENFECYQDIVNEQSNDHFFSNYEPPASGESCGTHDSYCGPLSDSCSHPNYANHPTCTDYCDMPENMGDRSWQERECYLDPSSINCGPPTPDECAASSSAGDPFLGCKDWCESDARYATYPQCSGGGVPSIEGATCATEQECFEQAQTRYKDECAGSTNQDWEFNYTTYEYSLKCNFDNGGSAGGNSSGEFLDNTSDNVNTPDRTADNTPDNTPEADALDAADNQVAALNNANKNLNAIESQSERTNENLSIISGQLDEIRAAIAASGDGDSGSGTGDLSGVESRLDSMIDYEQSDPTAAIETINTSHPASDITNEIDLSQIQFDAEGFLGGGSCPSPVSFDVFGSSFHYTFEFICGLAPAVRPWVIGLAYIFAMFTFVRIVGS